MSDPLPEGVCCWNFVVEDPCHCACQTALSRQTEALKACRERCAGVEVKLEEYKVGIVKWSEDCKDESDRADTAEAALKAAREALQDKSEWAKKMRQSYEDEIASSRQRAERYREALERSGNLPWATGQDTPHYKSVALPHAVWLDWRRQVEAALADDKPQEPVNKCGRLYCCDGMLTSWISGVGTSEVPCPKCAGGKP